MTGLGFFGERYCSLRFPRAFLEGAAGDICSRAVSKLAVDDLEGDP